MSNIFYNDPTLDGYEEKEAWEWCMEYLQNAIMRHPDRQDIFLRYAAQAWYVLSFWDCCMPTERMNRHSFEIPMKHAYMLAREHFGIDADCLWLFGYFMTVSPFAFPFLDLDCLSIEQKGNKLIEVAHTCAPANPYASILFKNNKENKKSSSNKLLSLAALTKAFPSKSRVDRYFLGVFQYLFNIQ